MKLLVAVPSYLPGYRYGGPIRSVHGAARELVARGHQVRVLTTDCDQGVRLDVPNGGVEIDGVEVRHCRWTGPAQLRHAPSFRRAAEEWLADTDLVWVNGVFELCSSRAMRAARAAGVPYVVSPRGMLDTTMLATRGRWRKRAWLSMGDRRALLDAAAWHLTAELERETLPDLGVERPPCFVVENGVDHEPFDGRIDLLHEPVRSLLRDGTRKLLFLGRLSTKKGLERLIPSLPALPSDVRLVIAGPDEGARSELEVQVRLLGLEARVDFVGPVTGLARAALLERSELLVLPSRGENFGNVVLEALAAGTPAVVTPEVGAAEVLRRTGSGRVVEGTPVALGRELGRLLGDHEALRELRQRARSAVAEYSWPRITARLARLDPRV